MLKCNVVRCFIKLGPNARKIWRSRTNHEVATRNPLAFGGFGGCAFVRDTPAAIKGEGSVSGQEGAGDLLPPVALDRVPPEVGD